MTREYHRNAWCLNMGKIEGVDSKQTCWDRQTDKYGTNRHITKCPFFIQTFRKTP